MDRKSYKKIGRYLGLYLLYAIIFSAAMYLVARCEVAVKQQQQIALMSDHPELESEIIALWEKPLDYHLWMEEDSQEIQKTVRMIEEKYGYNFERAVLADMVRYIWGAVLLITAVITGILLYRDLRKDRRNGSMEKEAEELYECLERFREGEFHEIPETPENSQVWMKLWETVRELGTYFEDLRDRSIAEEDRTKALITDISHQLKTPLASLRMSYELVASEGLTEEERREFQEQEAKEIEKLEMLLDELVELSRLETHMIQIRPVYGSIKKTITDAVNQIYVKAKNKEIEIQVEMDGDMQICHDAKWTAEALENVLDNAVKYSGEHTVITVRVIPLIQNVLIEIEDEGMGIRSEELHKIYHRFYRGDEAAKKVKEGAGVGLYLARRILEQQGGTISAKGKSSPGTIFKMTLPR